MIRKARLKDIKAIYELLEAFAKTGELLHRPLPELYSNCREFFICELDGEIVGVCGLHVWWEDLAEIRSLAVKRDVTGKGIGKELVGACLEEARKLGVKKVFVLTYREEFFKKLGFTPIDKNVLPQKIWGECVKCVKFPTCDENALVMELEDENEGKNRKHR